jgi:hypothetical protein
MPQALPVRQAAAAATFALPFALPEGREWFSVHQVAELSGMSDRYVEEAFDAGRILSGHVHNSRGLDGARMTKRIPRAWVIAFLAETARYELTDLADALERGLRNYSVELLLRLRGALERELKRRSA